MKKLRFKLTPLGWSILIILCLLSVNAWAKPKNMNCETIEGFRRCENEEVVCYHFWGTSGSLQCKFKK